MKLDPITRSKTIEQTLKQIREQYVFPDVAHKMEQAILARQATEEYENITDGAQLARKLTRELQEVSQDLHLRVEYSQETLPEVAPMAPPTPEMWQRMREENAKDNFGWEKVEVLPGNIGYIKVNHFLSLEWMGETLTAAMNFVSQTDALILDLRDNGGSMDPEAIPLLCSYFFEKPTHINSIYWRPSNTTTDFYTRENVAGKRYLKKPLYVLTSERTFSGAEELAYDLQTQKRATIVGATTGGGANPGGSQRVNDHFAVWVPVGRAINPITKTNWEGVGVKPEVVVPAQHALDTAHRLALRERLTTAPEWEKPLLRPLLENLEKKVPVYRPVTFTLTGYPQAKTVTVSGTFNSWA